MSQESSCTATAMQFGFSPQNVSKANSERTQRRGTTQSSTNQAERSSGHCAKGQTQAMTFCTVIDGRPCAGVCPVPSKVVEEEEECRHDYLPGHIDASLVVVRGSKRIGFVFVRDSKKNGVRDSKITAIPQPMSGLHRNIAWEITPETLHPGL
eukprot:1743448-Amphidinium_carterae.1